VAFFILLQFTLAKCATDGTQRNDNATPVAAPVEVSSAVITPEEYTPVTTDFKASIAILEKKCFGSAGCNVGYRVVPEYLGLALTDAQSFTVTYTIKGGEDLIEGNFTITGDVMEFRQKELTQTSRASAKLVIEITSVLAN
jgi:hypothetical protein